MQEQEQRSEKAKDGGGFYEDHKSSNVTWVFSTAKMTTDSLILIFNVFGKVK